jgi:transposase
MPGGGEHTDRVSGVTKTRVTTQKKSFVASERNEQQRRAFRREVAELNVEDFVFVDEMGLNLNLAREYGRAAPGERVVAPKPSTRGENLSVIGALGADALRAVMSVPGAVDGDAFLSFIKHVLAPRLHPGNIVFMDNVPTHKMPTIADAIAGVGARVHFLPPYSPDFSPIEHCWGKLKTFLRRVAARTQQALDAALSDALATITHDNIKGWFTHCGYVDALN